ncbi:MAG: hypothetical protein JWQ71_901 [Pedosphaera sp.]|nr:hypothetical protein [Pedosphaera sp.]
MSNQEDQRNLAQRIFPLLLLAFFACVVWLLLVALQLAPAKNSHLLEATFLVLAAVLTVASLARRLPVENAIMAAIYVAAISFIVEIVGVKTGIPFGPLTYTESFGPQLFHVPWLVPLLWIIVILNSRGVAKLILRPWRKANNYGFWVMGLTCLLALDLDLGLEPFATRINHLWNWKSVGNSLSWYDSPWTNFLGWAATTLLILIFTTLWLINKRASQQETIDYPPLVLWLGLNFFLAGINAIHGLWLAAAFGLCIGTLALVFALRGARHSALTKPAI